MATMFVPTSRRGLLPAFLLALIAGAARATPFTVAPVFGSGMVLQRAPAKSAVYGTSEPGDTVTIKVTPAAGGAAIRSTGVADSTGQWKAFLPPKAPGGNFTLAVTSAKNGTAISLARVTFGDVYFCSGQSNMELGLKFTLSRNESFDAIRAGKYADVRLFHGDHNPQVEPVYVGAPPVVAGWSTPLEALSAGTLEAFSATCWYFGKALRDRMEAAGGGAEGAGAVVPLGLIESAYGGTMVESWIPAELQFACSNITCTAAQTKPFTRGTAAACFAAAAAAAGKGPGKGGAGANGQLFNGMVAPYVNMTVKGWAWYQGENNLPFMAGNVQDRAGYACLEALLVSAWRDAWSRVPGTTDPAASPFGIVLLADSTDEGWGSNVPQMHWAQTANVGHAPNRFLPHTFLATAHDLADPWDDGCMDGAACCVDTGPPSAHPIDPRCNAAHRGFLIQTGKYPGAGAPVTPSMGPTIHPRVKRQVGARLAQAAWSLVYNHSEVPWTGPVLAGCSVEDWKDDEGEEEEEEEEEDRADGGKEKLTATTTTMLTAASTSTSTRGLAAGKGRRLRIRFNQTLLKPGGRVSVAAYNRTEKASVMWVLVDHQVPADAAKNWQYANREPWWGDSQPAWQNVDYVLDPSDGSVVADLPPTGQITAVKYGHISPKGSPQSGHDKICCGNRNFATDPCAPESCPIWGLVDGAAASDRLPAMPFHAAIEGGKCKCFLPQVCDG